MEKDYLTLALAELGIPNERNAGWHIYPDRVVVLDNCGIAGTKKREVSIAVLDARYEREELDRWVDAHIDDVITPEPQPVPTQAKPKAHSRRK